MSEVHVSSTALTGKLWSKHPIVRGNSGLVMDITNDHNDFHSSVVGDRHRNYNNTHSAARSRSKKRNFLAPSGTGLSGIAPPTFADRSSSHPQPPSFTAIAFNPFDEQSFVVGDSSGSVYHFNLRLNRFTLVARLTPSSPSSTSSSATSAASGGIISLTFLSSVHQPIIACSLGNSVVLVHIETAKVLRRFSGPHTGPILKIITSPMAPPEDVMSAGMTTRRWRSLLISLSSDTMAVWNPTAPNMGTGRTAKAWGNGQPPHPNDPTPVDVTNDRSHIANDNGKVILHENNQSSSGAAPAAASSSGCGPCLISWGRPNTPTDVCFSPDGAEFYTCSDRESSVRCVDVTTLVERKAVILNGGYSLSTIAVGAHFVAVGTAVKSSSAARGSANSSGGSSGDERSGSSGNNKTKKSSGGDSGGAVGSPVILLVRPKTLQPLWVVAIRGARFGCKMSHIVNMALSTPDCSDEGQNPKAHHPPRAEVLLGTLHHDHTYTMTYAVESATPLGSGTDGGDIVPHPDFGEFAATSKQAVTTGALEKKSGDLEGVNNAAPSQQQEQKQQELQLSVLQTLELNMYRPPVDPSKPVDGPGSHRWAAGGASVVGLAPGKRQAGPRYIALLAAGRLQLFHLATAKLLYDQQMRTEIPRPGISTGARGSLARHDVKNNKRGAKGGSRKFELPVAILPFVGRENVVSVEQHNRGSNNDNDLISDGSEVQPVVKPALAPPSEEKVKADWVKVNLLDSAEKSGSSQMAMYFPGEAIRDSYGAEATVDASGKSHPKSDRRKVTEDGALTQLPLTACDNDRRVSFAADPVEGIRAPPQHLSVTDKAGVTATKGRRGGAEKGTPTLGKGKNGKGTRFEGSPDGDQNAAAVLRCLVDKDSRAVNMAKLRKTLLKFGAFPEKYRAVIWRFLLQIPDKRALAPYYAVLSNRGKHPGVASLMAPFPLPNSRTKQLLEKTLSVLSHHMPVFSVAHWIPSVVFPFVSVYGADIQGCVEVILSFFINWGQEFFAYYPHMPVGAAALITHFLEREEPELTHHLRDVLQVDPESYVWEPLCALYTEVLTKNEWLQLMDHVFANDPLWLWLWHVRWLGSIKALLMETSSPQAVLETMHRTAPFDINATIVATYALHQTIESNELTAPYQQQQLFPMSVDAPHQMNSTESGKKSGKAGKDKTATAVTFSVGGYPVNLATHNSVVVSKLQAVKAIAAHEGRLAQAVERQEKLQKQLKDAQLLETALTGRQRATVAAKHVASNALWEQRVLLEREKARSRDYEHQERLSAVNDQLRTAKRLEELQQELSEAATAVVHTGVEQEAELERWNAAGRMAEFEVRRMEGLAATKIAAALHRMSPDVVNTVRGHVDPRAQPLFERPLNVPNPAGGQHVNAVYHTTQPMKAVSNNKVAPVKRVTVQQPLPTQSKSAHHDDQQHEILSSSTSRSPSAGDTEHRDADVVYRNALPRGAGTLVSEAYEEEFQDDTHQGEDGNHQQYVTHPQVRPSVPISPAAHQTTTGGGGGGPTRHHSSGGTALGLNNPDDVEESSEVYIRQGSDRQVTTARPDGLSPVPWQSNRLQQHPVTSSLTLGQSASRGGGGSGRRPLLSPQRLRLNLRGSLGGHQRRPPRSSSGGGGRGSGAIGALGGAAHHPEISGDHPDHYDQPSTTNPTTIDGGGTAATSLVAPGIGSHDGNDEEFDDDYRHDELDDHHHQHYHRMEGGEDTTQTSSGDTATTYSYSEGSGTASPTYMAGGGSGGAAASGRGDVNSYSNRLTQHQHPYHDYYVGGGGGGQQQGYQQRLSPPHLQHTQSPSYYLQSHHNHHHQQQQQRQAQAQAQQSWREGHGHTNNGGVASSASASMLPPEGGVHQRLHQPPAALLGGSSTAAVTQTHHTSQPPHPPQSSSSSPTQNPYQQRPTGAATTTAAAAIAAGGVTTISSTTNTTGETHHTTMTTTTTNNNTTTNTNTTTATTDSSVPTSRLLEDEEGGGGEGGHGHDVHRDEDEDSTSPVVTTYDNSSASAHSSSTLRLQRRQAELMHQQYEEERTKQGGIDGDSSDVDEVVASEDDDENSGAEQNIEDAKAQAMMEMNLLQQTIRERMLRGGGGTAAATYQQHVSTTTTENTTTNATNTTATTFSSGVEEIDEDDEDDDDYDSPNAVNAVASAAYNDGVRGNQAAAHHRQNHSRSSVTSTHSSSSNSVLNETREQIEQLQREIRERVTAAVQEQREVLASLHLTNSNTSASSSSPTNNNNTSASGPATPRNHGSPQ